MDSYGSIALDATEKAYSAYESRGVASLVATGVLSMISVLVVFSIIAVCAIRSIKNPDENPFIRTYVAGYFVSLLLCDLGQSIGALMNIRWLSLMGVHTGSFCTAQAAIKQASNVGTALWSLVIAIHTFNLLFLRFQAGKAIFLTTLVGVWSMLGMVLLIGPAARENERSGPFYGISGYWCWISPNYSTERYVLEYLFMFFSAGASLILYSLIFFRLRGNISVDGFRIRFRRIRRNKAWQADREESPIMSIARQMMWYPIGYIILILPIAAARFSDWAGRPVPFEVTIFSASVFMLSGFLNAILFITTRRVVPARTLVPSFLRSKETNTTSTKEYATSSFASAKLGSVSSFYRSSSSLGADLEAQTRSPTVYPTRPTVDSNVTRTPQAQFSPSPTHDFEVIDIGPPSLPQRI